MNLIIISFSVLVLSILSANESSENETINPQSLPLNHPGIKWDWNIIADNYNFTVDTVSNYDMKGVGFTKDNKTLTLVGDSSHDGNIAEIQIPHDLIDGSFTVFQDGKEIFPLILKSGNTTLVVLKFNQTGVTTTSIVGTTYLPEFAGVSSIVLILSFVLLFLILKTGKLYRYPFI